MSLTLKLALSPLLVAGADARRHNAALRGWAATGADVSCVDMQMALDPAGMASDGFHPGAAVYRWCANAIATHLAAQDWRHDLAETTA